MSEYIHKSHNVSVLLYHFVCPSKYRRVVFSDSVDKELKKICLEMSLRYEINFIEIGTDSNHVHFLVQCVPTMSPSRAIQIIKSLTAREIFKRCPEVKNILWGGAFWTSGYFVNTVGQYASEDVIQEYVKNQGKSEEYTKLHSQQLELDLKW